jgi:hypothetical protein
VCSCLSKKGDIIEALWTEDDKDDEWFTVEVLLPNAYQLQARKEKRERYMKCHQIQRMGSSLLARSPHQANGPSGRIPVRKDQCQAASSIGGGSVALLALHATRPCEVFSVPEQMGRALGSERARACAVPLWREERVPARGLAPDAGPDTGARQGPAGHALGLQWAKNPLRRLMKTSHLWSLVPTTKVG